MSCIKFEKILNDIAKIGKKYNCTKIVLFGSRAKGTNNEKSDIDIAVYGGKNFDLLKEEIEENLETLLEIDIINIKDDTADELKREIQKYGKIIYEKI